VIEFLTEYGMFLAKVVTFVLAALFIIGGIASAAGRNRGQHDEGEIRLRHFNKHLEALRNGIRNELLRDGERKKEEKKRRKEEKQQAKAEKKASAISRPRQRVFVLDFDGDIRASDVDNLRREISAILEVARQEDEVVLRLESPGGVVHGYGLAASQLERIRKHGMKLTVCVDKVAASGGYMMACIGERIIAAPFAILGSIGVVAQIPNIHRLLKKHDVDVELMTAGEYKRTLTVLGENTEQGREKFQEDLEDTHTLFKDFVRDHRRGIDISRVATGEHWFGTRARALGLVDELMTSDEYLIERARQTDVYEISWEQKRKLTEKLGLSLEGGLSRAFDRVLTRLNGPWWQ
jgi:serine protease SohB